MKNKLFLLIALIAGIAHCDKLYFVGYLRDYALVNSTNLTTSTEHQYLWLKDDSTFVQADFYKALTGEQSWPQTTRKGKWLLSADSLILIGNSCRHRGNDCEVISEWFTFKNDSLYAPASKRLDPKTDSIVIKNMSKSEEEIQSGQSNYNAIVITLLLVGALIVVIAGASNK